ncbi:hypothetical protein M1K46_20455 [Fictibacillus sp. WQ 8-8]|uniref:hypothetical protein n=1 Tax=Fictibacillus sp. WQ 8-8 TaxID=2938788 RepID=UPI00210D0FA7|nr:hypothetical protein [Fictibacillus sp. WQ 8-8]MCQ6267996.1 hypothetical protein [Fictibacillus sp. WQ 8-8]
MAEQTISAFLKNAEKAGSLDEPAFLLIQAVYIKFDRTVNVMFWPVFLSFPPVKSVFWQVNSRFGQLMHL